MNENIIPKPPKLITAIIFLYITYFMNILNMGLKIITPSFQSSMFIIINNTILLLIIVIWLTYLISKGNNWARFFLLILFIILSISFAEQIIHFKRPIGTQLQNIILIVLGILCFLLLFSKESSTWFKLIKKSRNRKNLVNNKFKISSICLYFALSINVLHFLTAETKVIFYGSRGLNDIIYYFYCLTITVAMNLLFIISIKKGSKLAGIIYLALIIIAESTDISIFGYFINSFLSLWNIRVVLLVIAFIVLFQTEIISFFNKLIKKQ